MSNQNSQKNLNFNYLCISISGLSGRNKLFLLLSFLFFQVSLPAQNFNILRFNQATTGYYHRDYMMEEDENFSPGLVELNGYLYGSFSDGGSRGYGGTLFRMSQDGSDFTVIKEFSDDAYTPTGMLTVGNDGYLYGTLRWGSTYGGALFKIMADGSNYTVLKYFDDQSGKNPTAKVLVKGNVIYGTTHMSGSDWGGTLYRVNTDGSDFAVLMNFNNAIGNWPNGGLVADENGYLYGTTQMGGNFSAGTIFKIRTDGSEFANLKHLHDQATGYYSNNDLLLNGDYLYATTTRGGSNWNGTILKLKTDGDEFSVLHQFDYGTSIGTNPTGGLTLGNDGYFYGMTANGGMNGGGTIYRMNSYGDLTNVKNFKWMQEGTPGGTLLAVPGSDKLFGFFNEAPSNWEGGIFAFGDQPAPGNQPSPISFNGIDQYIKIPANNQLEFTTGTIEMWVKPGWTRGSHNYGNPTLIAEQSQSNTRFSVHMLNDLNGIGVWNGTSWQYVDYPFSQNEWVHIACVLHENYTSFYVNGNFAGETYNGINNDVSNLDLTIGCAFAGVGEEMFEGEMNEIRIWNTERSGADIANSYATSVDPQSYGLVAYYPVEEDVTAPNNSIFKIFKDESNTGANGTLVNYWNNTATIDVLNVFENNHCANDLLTVGFTSEQVFDYSNQFTLQISEVGGSFDQPTVLQVNEANVADNISGLLPAHLASGNYKVRVVSSSPYIVGNPSEFMVISDRPYAPEIRGKKMVNTGKQYNYQVEPTPGNTTMWINETPLPVVGNPVQLSWPVAGRNREIKAYEINDTGCIGDTATKQVDVYILSISNVLLQTRSICPGSQFNVRATVDGLFKKESTELVAQLSNASGLFVKPTIIGRVPFDLVDKLSEVEIPVTIPGNTKSSDQYKIRVVAVRPEVIGDDNGFDISISNPNLGGDRLVKKCAGTSIDISNIFKSEHLHLDWGFLDPHNVTEPGIYTVVARNGNGCPAVAKIEVKDIAVPDLGESQQITVPAGTPVNLAGLYNTENFNARWNITNPKSVITPGRYRLIASNQGCSDTVFVRVIHSGFASGQFREANTDKMLEPTSSQASIFPNPATTRAMLKLTDTQANATITIADMTGRVIYTSKLLNQTAFSLPVQRLAKGMYQITVKSGTSAVTLPLLKQ